MRIAALLLALVTLSGCVAYVPSRPYNPYHHHHHYHHYHQGW